MLLGLLGALACAVAYGVGTVLQAVGSRRLAQADGLDVRLLARLARSGPFLAGLALDGVGFAASVFALRTLPLFLVESAIASSVGVTALVASRWLGTALHRTQLLALTGLGVGLVLLAASAQADAGGALPLAGQWVVLAAALPMAGVAAVAPRWPAPRAAAAFAALAGLGFGGVGVAARALVVPTPWWQVALSPLLWALVVHGVLATYCYAAALQRGSATVVAGVAFAVETVIPAAIGIALLGDRVRPGFGVVAVLGMAATLAAAVVLAGSTQGL